jgi:protein-disulfide isomerase
MHDSKIGKSLMLLALSFALAAAAAAQDAPKLKAHPVGTKRLAAKHGRLAKSDAITKEQADAIVDELKQIRQLLEKQQVQMARATAPQQPATPAPPEKIQMSVGNGWYAIGRPDAPVTLVEFGDYQCPFCKRFHTDAYAELKKTYIDTGKVRFVSRDLPLDFHPFALKAAEAVRCAGDQDKYWELRNALYSDANPPNDDVIKKAAEQVQGRRAERRERCGHAANQRNADVCVGEECDGQAGRRAHRRRSAVCHVPGGD